MKKHLSPLRYPGGKSILFPIIKKIIDDNNLDCFTYIEPFAGGCGIGIRLLLDGICNKLIINDADIRIYCFWKSILEHTDEFCNLIEKTSITIEEWHNQKDILTNYENYDELQVGFATFFLNRCNRSGILSAGPIGGFAQSGDYKIDCRFKKDLLINKIRNIEKYKSLIEIYNLDANTFINELETRKEAMLIYFDPPYIDAGKELYLNYYNDEDHEILATSIKNHLSDKKWILTYDCKPIISTYYNGYNQKEIDIQYFLETKRRGKELLISNNLIVNI